MSFKTFFFSEVDSGSDEYSLTNVLFSSDIHASDVLNSVFLPFGVPSVVELSSDDVIHSFTVPCLGFKIDCIPGKRSEVGVVLSSSGLFHGHCAEICGAGHSVMPIEIVGF